MLLCFRQFITFLKEKATDTKEMVVIVYMALLFFQQNYGLYF